VAASLVEVETLWTLEDVLLVNEALDLKDEAIRMERKRIEAEQRRAGHGEHS
jgi:hypothetical protein